MSDQENSTPEEINLPGEESRQTEPESHLSDEHPGGVLSGPPGERAESGEGIDSDNRSEKNGEEVVRSLTVIPEFSSREISDEPHDVTPAEDETHDEKSSVEGAEEAYGQATEGNMTDSSPAETGTDEIESDEVSEKEEIIDEVAHVIEAVVFASDEPITPLTIKSVLEAARTYGRVNVDSIVSRIRALNENYEANGSGFRIIEVANGYQFATRKDMAQWVSNLFKERSKRRLSNSALETLAIIAYKQPITKPEIENIRGVNIDYVLHSLLEKEIVTVTGRAESVGRPLLYGTTQKFLKVFGLKNLEDLPKLREIDEIIREIKSKGAEESIQLEITALGDQSIPDNKNGGEVPMVPQTENGTADQQER